MGTVKGSVTSSQRNREGAAAVPSPLRRSLGLRPVRECRTKATSGALERIQRRRSVTAQSAVQMGVTQVATGRSGSPRSEATRGPFGSPDVLLPCGFGPVAPLGVLGWRRPAGAG